MRQMPVNEPGTTGRHSARKPDAQIRTHESQRYMPLQGQVAGVGGLEQANFTSRPHTVRIRLQPGKMAASIQASPRTSLLGLGHPARSPPTASTGTTTTTTTTSTTAAPGTASNAAHPWSAPG